MLEIKYNDLLTVYGVHYESHVTRFADNIVSQVPGLEKRTVENKAIILFRSCEALIIPLREAMKNICNKFEMKFTKNSQRSSVPIELLTLVSMLIDGMDITDELFSQSALTCTQQIMFNFKSYI